MPHFNCRFCGIVSDDPEIIPLPEKDAEFRAMFAEYEDTWKTGLSVDVLAIPAFARMHFEAIESYESSLKAKYNHMIICPICMGETTFWRESPFPLRKGLTDLDGSPLSLSVRGLIAEIEAQKAGE